MNTDKGNYTTVPIDVAIKINGVQLQLDPQRLLNSSEMSPSQLHFKFPTTENSNLYLHFSSNSLFHHLTLSQHKTLFPTLLTEKMRGRNFSSCLSSHFHRDLISYPYFSSFAYTKFPSVQLPSSPSTYWLVFLLPITGKFQFPFSYFPFIHIFCNLASDSTSSLK